MNIEYLRIYSEISLYYASQKKNKKAKLFFTKAVESANAPEMIESVLNKLIKKYGNKTVKINKQLFTANVFMLKKYSIIKKK